MKKGLSIVLVTLTVLACAAGLYLSHTVIKYNNMKNRCIHIGEHLEEYPYETEQAPADFAEFTIKGIKFSAPQDLERQYPDADGGLKEGIFAGSGSNSSLSVLVFDPETPTLPQGYELGKAGFFSGSVQSNMKKMGYKIPENYYELFCLLGTIDRKDCNKFSLSQVSTFCKLAQFKEIMTPSVLGYKDGDVSYTSTQRYYRTGDKCSCIFTEQKNDSGDYKLVVEFYNNDTPDCYQDILITGRDSKTIQQIANTLTVSE